MTTHHNHSLENLSLLDLGKEFQALVSRANDEAPSPEFDARLDVLKNAIAHRPAGTEADALIQMVSLTGELDELANADLDRDEAIAARDRTKRLAYSVLNVLERQTGLSREEFGGEFSASRRLDPFAKSAA